MLVGILFLGLSIGIAAESCCSYTGTSKNVITNEMQQSLKVGKKVPVEGGNYLVYNFSKKPAIGTTILVVKVYNNRGEQIAPYEIIGDYGMPSMKSHDSGDIAFQTNNKQDYLLPVNVVMRGNWEVRLKILKADKEVLSGNIEFKI
jgi:hypothetical protein